MTQADWPFADPGANENACSTFKKSGSLFAVIPQLHLPRSAMELIINSKSKNNQQ